jgi:hypothetical protein
MTTVILPHKAQTHSQANAHTVTTRTFVNFIP